MALAGERWHCLAYVSPAMHSGLLRARPTSHLCATGTLLHREHCMTHTSRRHAWYAWHGLHGVVHAWAVPVYGTWHPSCTSRGTHEHCIAHAHKHLRALAQAADQAVPVGGGPTCPLGKPSGRARASLGQGGALSLSALSALPLPLVPAGASIYVAWHIWW